MFSPQQQKKKDYQSTINQNYKYLKIFQTNRPQQMFIYLQQKNFNSRTNTYITKKNSNSRTNTYIKKKSMHLINTNDFRYMIY